MMQFIFNDPSLLQAMQSGSQPTPAQLSKLTKFMINDKFFQNQLLDSIAADPQNAWVKTMSKNAQLRYLKIITSVPQDKLNNPAIMKQIINRLAKDKEIGPALAKQYGNNLETGEFLKQLQSGLQQSISTATHHAMAF